MCVFLVDVHIGNTQGEALALRALPRYQGDKLIMENTLFCAQSKLYEIKYLFNWNRAVKKKAWINIRKAEDAGVPRACGTTANIV